MVDISGNRVVCYYWHLIFFSLLTFRALVKELVETEEEFVTDMEHVVNVYYRQMDHPSTPRTVSDQRDALFGPFKQIQEFHKRFIQVFIFSAMN